MATHDKYKTCPACGAQNDARLLECITCEADLTMVAIGDTQPTITPQTSPAPCAPLPGELCRTCDCGAPNPPQARKCCLCNEDISDVRPGPYCEPLQERVFVLQCNDYCFTIPNKECVLGRNADMSDFLAAKSFVSRRHAKLNICNGVLFIENLSATNPTFVNNVKLENATPCALKDGDEISLGGNRINGKPQEQAAYFTVKVTA